MMSELAFTLTIKPAEDTQLDLLEKEFSPHNLSKSHYKRYDVQKRQALLRRKLQLAHRLLPLVQKE